MLDQPNAEPWLRGTLTELPAIIRAVLHALQLAREDAQKWCADLNDEEINARPAGAAPVAFHLRHIGRSIDRLLTYLEANSLSEQQLADLGSELEPDAHTSEVLAELGKRLVESENRIRRTDPATFEERRTVGRLKSPTTVAGLLVHIAEHTQRHVGQAVTTAKIVRATRRCTFQQ